MSDVAESWSMRAACSRCDRSLTPNGAAVLRRQTMFGPRGVMVDVMIERWPEDGELLHSSCFGHAYGRRALYTAFVRGRFDNGLATDCRDVRAKRTGTVDGGPSLSKPTWTLTATCCGCRKQVASSGPGLVSDRRSNDRWLWVPFMQERRPAQGCVMHPGCFVDLHGKSGLYEAFGRDLWKRAGPLIKRAAGAVS